MIVGTGDSRMLVASTRPYTSHMFSRSEAPVELHAWKLSELDPATGGWRALNKEDDEDEDDAADQSADGSGSGSGSGSASTSEPAAAAAAAAASEAVHISMRPAEGAAETMSADQVSLEEDDDGEFVEVTLGEACHQRWQPSHQPELSSNDQHRYAGIAGFQVTSMLAVDVSLLALGRAQRLLVSAAGEQLVSQNNVGTQVQERG